MRLLISFSFTDIAVDGWALTLLSEDNLSVPDNRPQHRLLCVVYGVPRFEQRCVLVCFSSTLAMDNVVMLI
jgi:hypothetical protein